MHSKSKDLSNLIVMAASLIATISLGNAAIVQTTAMNNSQSAFDGNISATDLINTGQATLGGFTSSFAASIGPSDSTGVHNGIGTNTSGLAYWGGGHGGLVTLTYTLAGSATGYDITSINSIYGWNDSRERHVAQRYTVEVTTVSNASFTLLDTVAFDPYTDNAQGGSQVTITEDTNGILASGVTGIRFALSNDPGSSNEVGVVREFDVFGAPTVAAAIPEPSSALLFGIVGFGYLLRRRR